ncbi:hypothetical protein RVR_9559 [Actinacidiphila reveromycinica]|uniref:DUF35 domain-containing protein n=1 Tax=Actinacidiphila reveromycinica TaxID=659352 RepID=A0A7U3VSL4_9ACTN|nr:hypothetical protein [Streptomyces sp. SN-593]BBB01924.1 hypothetical protein RVR_9559 [Streptomyces sp. SN-593]
MRPWEYADAPAAETADPGGSAAGAGTADPGGSAAGAQTAPGPVPDSGAEPPAGGREVVLRAVRCLTCRHLSFPPQTYGCELCGAYGDALQPTLLPGRGTVLAAVALPGDSDAGRPAALLAEVRLAEDVVVRALAGAPAAPGTPVRAVAGTFMGRDTVLMVPEEGV